MPGTLVTTIFFSAVAIATYFGARAFFGSAGQSEEARSRLPLRLTWIPLGLAAFFFLFSVVTIVPTREIGIVTAFGKPVRSLSNGLHIKLPWEDVHQLDGTIQTDNHTTPVHCTDIRIGNESTACIDNTIRWRIKLSAGQRLYQDYREMDNIRDSLVTRELKAALNEVLSDYNPLEQIKADNESAKPDLNAFARSVQEGLSRRVGGDIEIESVILPIIRFDKQTQSKINAYQAEVANTRIAEQREQTAQAQARANRNLAGSISKDPNVLVAQCMDTLAEMVKESQKVPIGFSCWPGGSSSSVVLPKG
jgi:regulator of protease activity HflC (stomatin/prohibitin superfamily)